MAWRGEVVVDVYKMDISASNGFGNALYGYKVLLLLPYTDSLIACFVCSNSGHHNITICCHGNGCDFANSALCLHNEIRQKKKEIGNREKALV